MTSLGASPVDPSPEDADGRSVASGLTVSSLGTTLGAEPGLVADRPPVTPPATGPAWPQPGAAAVAVHTLSPRSPRTRGWTSVPTEATIALLGLACLLVFWKVGGLRLTGRNPFDWRFGPIFDRTTATGGDMGAHVWGPDAVRRNCLPQLRPSCWQNDVYGGMKYPQFYFPGPIWLIVFLSFVIPYTVAFKVVTILGLVLMPITGWAMGRLAKLDDPLPVLLGLATIPFIFDRQFFIYGGNMLSTMAGEFSFAISLMLGLLFIGLYIRVLRTGRGRAFAALTLGGMAISHLLPTMWTAMFFVCVSAVYVDPKRLGRQVLDAGLVGACGLALAGFWVIPFRSNLDYTNDMGWEKLNQYVGNLFPWLGKDGDPPTPLDGAGIATAALLLAAAGGLWAFLSFLRGTAPKRDGILATAYWPVVGAATLAGAAACIGGFSTVRHALVALLIVVPACAFISAAIISALTNSSALLKVAQLGLVIVPAAFIAVFWPDRFVNNDGHLGLLSVALIGVVGVVFVQTLSGAEYERFPLAVTMMTALAGGTFVLAPQFRLWNARVLPFWFLGVYLLAAIGVVAIVHAVSAALDWIGGAERRRIGSPVSVGLVLGATLTYLAIAGPLNLAWRNLPIPKVKGSLIGVQLARDTNDRSQAPGWAEHNYTGYESKGGWSEFQTLMTNLKSLSPNCGRAFWEYETENIERFGTSLSLMTIPYWTDGCIGSFEAVYFESSPTTPANFLTARLVSRSPSNPQRIMPYNDTFDLVKGVAKMRELGVRYYIAFTGEAVNAAQKMPEDLRLVRNSPLARVCDDNERNAFGCPTEWHIYEIINWGYVAPLTVEPVVVTGIGQSQESGWLDVTAAQFVDPVRYPALFAADGPKEWTRVKATYERSPEIIYGSKVTIDPHTPKPVASAQPLSVSDVAVGRSSIRFNVSEVGKPVMVRMSYFPNWKATGAQGPWRVSPNYMVVIPTSTDVRLDFTRDTADWLGLLSSAAGIAGLGGFAVGGRRRRRTTPESGPGSGVVASDGEVGDGSDLDRQPSVWPATRADGGEEWPAVEPTPVGDPVPVGAVAGSSAGLSAIAMDTFPTFGTDDVDDSGEQLADAGPSTVSRT